MSTRFDYNIPVSTGWGWWAVDSVNGQTGDVVLDIITSAERSKLAWIEAWAEVNNISDANATDLTDWGTTSLHNHDDRYTPTSSLWDLATLDTVDTEEIDNHAVTNTKLANMNANTVKGRLSGNGTPQDIAMADLPVSTATQTALNWKQATLWYTPEDVANKATTMTGNTASNTLYLTAKAIYDWATGLFATITWAQTLTNKTIDLWSNTLITNKAQLNTAVTDWDIPFTNQPNTFTENQTIKWPTSTTSGVLKVYDWSAFNRWVEFISPNSTWWKAKIKVVNSNSNITIWTRDFENVIEISWANGNLIVNWQNRTDWWTSWNGTISWSWGGTLWSFSPLGSIKTIWPNTHFKQYCFITKWSLTWDVRLSTPVVSVNNAYMAWYWHIDWLGVVTLVASAWYFEFRYWGSKLQRSSLLSTWIAIQVAWCYQTT